MTSSESRSVPVAGLRSLDVPALAGLLHAFVDPGWVMYDTFAVGPCPVNSLCAQRSPATLAYTADTGWEPWVACLRCGPGGVVRVFDLVARKMGNDEARVILMDCAENDCTWTAPAMKGEPGMTLKAAVELERAFPRGVVECADKRGCRVRSPLLLPALVLEAGRRRSHAGEPMIGLDLGVAGVGQYVRVPKFFGARSLGLLQQTWRAISSDLRARSLETACLGQSLMGMVCLAAIRVVDAEWGPRSEIDHVRPLALKPDDLFTPRQQNLVVEWLYVLNEDPERHVARRMSRVQAPAS